MGPLARMNLNCDRLPPEVQSLLADTGICFPSRNMFHSIVARAAEVYLALLEAERLLADYAVPTTSKVAVTPRAGTGFGCTEAPRGALWHRYEFDATGRVLNARLVPPTSQNQARIEADLRTALAALAPDSNDDELRLRGEQIIRNYDPCISCATHFLRLRTRRE